MKFFVSLLIIFYYVFTPQLLKSQNTFAFKCKVVHHKKGLLKNYNLIVNGQKATTNDAGLFLIPLNNNISYVKIELLPSNPIRYSILYPSAGHLAIPKDPNEILEIIIGNAEDNNLLKEYISLTQKKNTQNDNELKRFVSQQIDSLEKVLLQLNYTQADLEKAKFIQEGKDRFFSEIRKDIDEFSLRAANLIITLKYSGKYAQEDGLLNDDINQAVKKYTDIYEKLSSQTINYQKAITDYWNDDALSKTFNDLIVYGFNTLHEKKILGLMEVIDQINEYRQKIKKGQKIQKKEQDRIKQNIVSNITPIEPMIDELNALRMQFQIVFKK